jgi:hypothetical protein
MPQYAEIDTRITPISPVVGWYDTDAFAYGNLPNWASLVQLTPTQWSGRQNLQNWGVDQDGNLVPYTPTPPVLSISQAAVIASSAGLTISISGAINLDPTLFPIDPQTQSRLNAVVTAVAATGMFPGGTLTYPMLDSAGSWHLFTISQYLQVASAIASHVSTLYLIADGNPFGATTLPTPVAAVVVE